MAVQTVEYRPVLSQDTTRGPSMSVWGQLNIAGFREFGAGGFGAGGLVLDDDFAPAPTISSVAAIGTFGKWAAWAGTGTTEVDAAQEGGVLKINGTTTGKSFILSSNAGFCRMIGAAVSTVYPAYPGKIACEMRIALGSVSASQQGVFFGLADNTSTQLNSGDVTVMAVGGNVLTTTKNVLGVFNRTTTSPADFSAVFQPAGGTAVYPTGLTTMVNTVTGSNLSAWAAGTDGNGTGYVKIGFVYDPTAQNQPKLVTTASSAQTVGDVVKPLLQFYVNGQVAPAFLDFRAMGASTFPTGCVFSPVFQYINIAGATAPVYLDWIMFGAQATF